MIKFKNINFNKILFLLLRIGSLFFIIQGLYEIKSDTYINNINEFIIEGINSINVKLIGSDEVIKSISKYMYIVPMMILIYINFIKVMYNFDNGLSKMLKFRSKNFNDYLIIKNLLVFKYIIKDIMIFVTTLLLCILINRIQIDNLMTFIVNLIKVILIYIYIPITVINLSEKYQFSLVFLFGLITAVTYLVNLNILLVFCIISISLFFEYIFIRYIENNDDIIFYSFLRW